MVLGEGSEESRRSSPREPRDNVVAIVDTDEKKETAGESI